MLGLGVLTGVAFPLIVDRLGVQRFAQVDSPGFRVASLLAGVLVGGVNYLLVRAVVARRLRHLAARMQDVVTIVRAATATGDWTALQVSRCRVPVDTDDELAEPAAAFNALIGALDYNVAERGRLEDRLRHQAFHDPLTGLANRALFLDRVEHALARARRDGSTVAVMFVDLDEFKSVNDTWGHAIGDVLLTEVANRLRRTCRLADTVARLGGDEFAILLEDVDTTAADHLARRINQALREDHLLGNCHVAVGASIGIALSTADSEVDTPEGLLRRADAAMYLAKNEGKDGHQTSPQSDQGQARVRPTRPTRSR